MSNSIGEKFRITSFGSSHGKALGAVVDGCPANLELTVEDIQKAANYVFNGKPLTSILASEATINNQEEKLKTFAEEYKKI